MENCLVYFEKPFWVGIFERTEDGKISVAKGNVWCRTKKIMKCRNIFKNTIFRLKFSPAVETVVKDLRRNPNGCIEKQKADAGNRHWDKIAGVEITAEQNKQKRKEKKSQEKRDKNNERLS